ncbi:macro domain-containing protein [bacterium]|nr:macro domain-containing protein [bacterium]
MALPAKFKAGQILKHIEISNSRHFIVVIYDLLFEPVDCIVNAANGGLSHGGGIAAQISIAAGEALEIEGSEYVKKKGMIPTGEAVVTSAGKLPFKGVIHAVGPSIGMGNELELLVSAVYNSLLRAHERGWSSISFPAISSGIFAVPKEICSKGYVLGVIKFMQEFPDSNLKVARLCMHQSPLVEFVIKEIDKRISVFIEL